MNLTSIIKANLDRLNIKYDNLDSIQELSEIKNKIKWPDNFYQGSTELFKTYIQETGNEDFNGFEEFELEDEMPSTHNFRFIQDPQNIGFWESWEKEFTSVSPNKYLPFACDEDYFYFLCHNPDNENNPLIHSIDHEETQEEPYDENGLTLESLLALLEEKKQ
ncbi:hypothetical protein [Oceanospirillum sediminis]|uniref:Knr4/Smi1-like domain-containing protein n=1 Tax=Oceanospirillum sediminis TaxID=2760088 RepID=A0A839IW57_9GAMM|nr:hypothetical protein [Oceanospirillum sediminis]MBB1489188.1 hypothetical protein [Oceanospirillum sediminis]